MEKLNDTIDDAWFSGGCFPDRLQISLSEDAHVGLRMTDLEDYVDLQDLTGFTRLERELYDNLYDELAHNLINTKRILLW